MWITDEHFAGVDPRLQEQQVRISRLPWQLTEAGLMSERGCGESAREGICDERLEGSSPLICKQHRFFIVVEEEATLDFDEAGTDCEVQHQS